MVSEIVDLLSFLPSKDGLERDIKLEEGRKLGVNFCGDHEGKFEVHKLLTQEGLMLTYHLVGQTLIYNYTGKLH